MLAARAAARAGGFRVVLVTGRILTELEAEFPGLTARFDAVRCENGAVLAVDGMIQRLARPVDERLTRQLVDQGVVVRTGEVLLACDANAAPSRREERPKTQQTGALRFLRRDSADVGSRTPGTERRAPPGGPGPGARPRRGEGLTDCGGPDEVTMWGPVPSSAGADLGPSQERATQRPPTWSPHAVHAVPLRRAEHRAPQVPKVPFWRSHRWTKCPGAVIRGRSG